MVVRVRLFSPFSVVLNEKFLNFEFKELQRIKFEELLQELVRKYPAVKSLLPSTSDHDKVYGNLVPIRNGKVVFLNDEIFDNDTIEFYGSLSGG